MATVDHNGIIQLQQNDQLEPLDAAINLVVSSISNVFDSNIQLFKVADLAARTVLTGERDPSPENPLLVWRQDVEKFEFHSGAGWKSWPFPEGEDNNNIVIDGEIYQASGTITNIPQTPAYTNFQGTYARSFAVDAPFTPPLGWYFDVFTAETTGNNIVHPAGTWLNAEGKIRVRSIQVGHSSVASLKAIGWRLSKI